MTERCREDEQIFTQLTARVGCFRNERAMTDRASSVSATRKATTVPEETTRRDFLYIATAAFGGVGAALALYPFINQMEPDASTIAAGGPVELDVGKLAPDQQVVALWRRNPVFVVHRPPDALQRLQDPALLAQLADPQSSELQQPPYAVNWHRSIKPEFGVMVGICTHLGCIPEFDAKPNPTTPATNWPGGYYCPCHGSRYDLAGRVFQGVPAPYNLPVPPYHFSSATKIRIGENPAGASFDFSSILQV